jgi:D-alanyl-D-alanine carboxypeptidase
MKQLIITLLLLTITVIDSNSQFINSAENKPEKYKMFSGEGTLSSSGVVQIDSIKSIRLQFLLDSLHAANLYKGSAVCINIPGENNWYGKTGVSYGPNSIHNRMHFGIGSQTKTFISVIMLMLAQRNVLSLDDSLHKWLPSYNNINSSITIRQLLNHTSGLDHFNQGQAFSDSVFADMSRYWTNHEMISYFTPPPLFPAGTQWSYSNTNYVLAGMIIEAATDSSESVLIKKYILDPLGMENTFYPPDDKIADTVAHGWYNNSDLTILYPVTTSIYSAIDGAGCMYSCNDDMVKFYDALFTEKLINSSSLTEFLSYYPLAKNIGYGLGIFYERYSGHTFYHHGGDYWGYSSITIHDSASGINISILTNRFLTNYYTIAAALLDELFFNNITAVNGNENSVPVNYSLSQNYPNPFNPSTKIMFSVSKHGFTEIKLFDILGREAAVIASGEFSPGNYSIDFDASNLTGGVYFYRMLSGDFIQTRKLVILK